MSDGASKQTAKRSRVRANWTPPPGPLPAGDGGDARLRPGEGESLDMLSGEWRIFQRKDGHRYSTDDLLCAWFACRAAEDHAVRNLAWLKSPLVGDQEEYWLLPFAPGHGAILRDQEGCENQWSGSNWQRNWRYARRSGPGGHGAVRATLHGQPLS